MKFSVTRNIKLIYKKKVKDLILNITNFRLNTANMENLLFLRVVCIFENTLLMENC